MRRLRGSAKKNRDAGTPPPPIDAGAPPTTDAGTPPPTGGVGADGVWTPLSVIQVLNPMNCGAVGNGTTDDLAALNTTVNALPVNGGIVYFPTGKVFRKTNILLIGKSYVKLWATNRDAEIFSTIGGQYRHQSVLCRSTTGCGVFGLKLRSDATSRFDALEDHHISMDRTTLSEIVGNEIQSSAAAGVFFTGSNENYVEGNYIHHTWADQIHHTDGTTASWAWNNYLLNEAPSKGDDGIACVTYSVDGKRCADMEWWKNTILHSDWGRGYSVIGGDNILIHDN